jgi:hypothetical protein
MVLACAVGGYVTGCLNLPEIALPAAEIDLTFPAWTCWMKPRYEIGTGAELPPHAAITSAASAAMMRAARRLEASLEVQLLVLVIVTELSTTIDDAPGYMFAQHQGRATLKARDSSRTENTITGA